MNLKKKAETNENSLMIIIFLVILSLIIIFYYITGGSTLLKHKEPADISKSQNGTGLDITFYDSQGKEITIPEWFTTHGFSVVTTERSPECTTRVQCKGYEDNQKIGCVNNKCVLVVDKIKLGVRVYNPPSSQLGFIELQPVQDGTSPLAFWQALDKTIIPRLDPGDNPTGWYTPLMPVEQWVGQTVNFKVKVQGKNEYTGEINTVNDELQLIFGEDPTGAFIVELSTSVDFLN